MLFQVVLVIHLMVTVAMIATVLVQRSEGGGLGIGSTGGMGSFMTARGTTNLLTRTTAILFVAFVVTSVTLAIVSGATRERKSIVDQAPSTLPAPAAPANPAPPTR
jgi:preprotein translocase subunit SecG